MFRSLRSKLLAWVLLPLSGAVAVDAWITYGNALDTASVVQDRLLLGSARSGPGIPVEYRGRVFERFYRIDDRDSNGSGLGLAIVREFAAQVRAQVSLSTAAGGSGLAVTIKFPRQADPPTFTQVQE